MWSSDNVKKLPVTFKQPPVISSTFIDPDSKQMKCSVIVSLFSNIKTIDFDVIQSGDVQTLKISYAWPNASYIADEMFKKDYQNQTFIPKMHPKFLSTEQALQSVRENFEDAPVGCIEITLPTKVQLEPTSWKKTFNKKDDGTLIVFFEFDCLRDEYTISKTEKSLSFE